MKSIRLVPSLDMPIYKQIVTQLRFMIEAGQLVDGDRLPSSRILADNLDINRHTVAKAYSELRTAGLVDSHRNGMVVRGAEEARRVAAARGRADAILAEAVGRCLDLGLSAEEVSALASHLVTQHESSKLRVCFVECNRERSEYFAQELSGKLQIVVTPLVLGGFDPDSYDFDLVLTTFFHAGEVRRLMPGMAGDVVAVVLAPHVQTLVQLAGVPKHKRVGVLYSTEDQAQGIRDSLRQSGLENIEILEDTSDDSLAGVDLVVVPSEMPDLRDQLLGRTEVIEFGNILDEASTRMVAAVLDELYEASTRGPARVHHASSSRTIMSAT